VDRKSAKEALQQSGFKPQFIATGMEGFVFDIGDRLIAKVWIKKEPLEIQPLRSFYAQLREKRLPFATPLIHEVIKTDTGFTISLEEKLAGVSLRSILERDPESDILSQKGMDAIFSVVEALGTAGDIPVARDLALLNEPSLWMQNATWGTVLGDFMTLRVNKHKAVLQHVVSNLEYKLSRVVFLLKSLNVAHPGIIHGDICTENVLIDATTMTPTSLLDFGFLTTSADPLFDAVISTLIFDMYSSHSLKVRENLRERFAQKLGRPFREVYPLYKAAYALATSNAYSEDGDEGHFRWCVDILNDEETNSLIKS
jgi:aminoglycoside phosphotransferase (APT) family kinase protein